MAARRSQSCRRLDVASLIVAAKVAAMIAIDMTGGQRQRRTAGANWRRECPPIALEIIAFFGRS
jgi:hypothetical protein